MTPEQLAIEWRALRRFTPDKDVAAVRDYIDRAFEYAKRLPSSIDSLAAAIQANKIGDHEVWFYLGHSVKVRRFVQWMRLGHKGTEREEEPEYSVFSEASVVNQTLAEVAAAHASTAQPTRNARPPNGVMTPRRRGAPRARA